MIPFTHGYRCPRCADLFTHCSFNIAMQGCQEFRVKWYGYPMTARTWEPEENILDTSIINEYWKMKSNIVKPDTTQGMVEESEVRGEQSERCKSKRKKRKSTQKADNTTTTIEQEHDTGNRNRGSLNSNTTSMNEQSACRKNYVAKSQHTAGTYLV